MIESGLMKCKLAYDGYTNSFISIFDYDKYHLILKKDEWYNINVSKLRISISFSLITVYESETFINKHFYTIQELRKIKIEKILI